MVVGSAKPLIMRSRAPPVLALTGQFLEVPAGSANCKSYGEGLRVWGDITFHIFKEIILGGLGITVLHSRRSGVWGGVW